MICIKQVVACIGLMVFVGCAPTYEFSKTSTTGGLLSGDATAYVGIPQDRDVGTKVFYGSGRSTAQVVADAFSKYLADVSMGKKPETADEALKSARSGGFSYLIYPTVMRWEDHATEWNGVRDKIKVQISIMDAKTGDTIDSVVLKGFSSLVTVTPNRPEELLGEPINKYAAALFKDSKSN